MLCASAADGEMTGRRYFDSGRDIIVDDIVGLMVECVEVGHLEVLRSVTVPCLAGCNNGRHVSVSLSHDTSTR